MRIEIFRAGAQTDSAGNSKEWSEADLEKIAASYDPKNHEAPVCIGHPEHNAPAYGWVKSVTREGSRLWAEIGDLVSEFSTMLDKKMFKKRSISLYPDMKLRHIGFLGAQPPAVKGLEDFKFAEAGALTIEFMDWETSYGFQNVGRLFQGLRDWVIETKDLETADRLCPQYEIDALKAMRAEPKESFGYHENPNGDPIMSKEQETQNATFAEQLATLTTSVTALTTRAETAESKVATLEKEKKSAEFTAFADSLIRAGKLLPAQRAQTILVMESLADKAPVDFSEGEGASAKVVKKAPLKIYQDTLEAGPAQVTFGEIATKGKASPANEDDKLSTLTAQKLKDFPGMNYGEASKAVLQENPDLNITVEA